MVRLVVDSLAGLSEDYISKNMINCLDINLLDSLGNSIETNSEMEKIVRHGEKLGVLGSDPKRLISSFKDYIDFYSEPILYIATGTSFTDNYDRVFDYIEVNDRIRVFNSGTLDAGVQMLVDLAVKERNKGSSLEDIVSKLYIFRYNYLYQTAVAKTNNIITPYQNLYIDSAGLINVTQNFKNKSTVLGLMLEDLRLMSSVIITYSKFNPTILALILRIKAEYPEIKINHRPCNPALINYMGSEVIMFTCRRRKKVFK